MSLDEAGLEDSAILLMSLGEEEAAAVFRHLSPREVQSLGATIARMTSVPKERLDKVLAKFTSTAQSRSPLVSDTGNYVKNVLRKALDEDKANLLIDRILQNGDISGIEGLKWMDAASIGEMLRQEHPQIVAAVLVHLDSDQAAAVLKTFPERQRNEVLVRIATLDGIQPSALKDLSEVMGRMVSGGEQARMAPLGGVKTAAEMINLLGTSIETAALDYIREADNDLAQRIMDNLFTFDDLMLVDDRGIQALLKEVQSESLVVALKGAKPELRDRILKNMSTRAAEMINLLGTSIETAALDYIREADNDLAQRVMDNLFTFDDLMRVDDRGIQALLKEVQSESLVIALKGAKPELRDRILKNMSTRAAETLKEELEARGPVRVAEVEAEQKELLKVVRRLAEEGQLVIGGGSGDDFL